LLCVAVPFHAQQPSPPAANPPIGAGDGHDAKDSDAVHVGGPVKPPVLIRSVDPSISNEMRKEKFNGTVQVHLIIETDGKPTHVQVVRGLGNDFDDAAVRAVSQYRFKPATRDGKPVKVDLFIDVNFNVF